MIEPTMTAPEPGAGDFLYLLDRLEEALVTGSRVPLTARTLVDEQECLDIIDQLRVSLPRELKEARRILEERDQLLAQAQEETERAIRAAELKANRLVEEHALVRAATARALALEERADQEAREIRLEAERYVRQLLQRLHERLEQAMNGVEAGLHELGQSDPIERE
ncbi:MAG: ATPase [Chloroflexota bacterium]|nr:ATPase [Chloroflexota bacterium]